MAKQSKEPESAPPSSPYLAAQRVWNERYGDAIQSARNWRRAALGFGAIAAVAVGGTVYMASQSSVVPYAVQMNSHNEVVRVARADVARIPEVNEVRAALRKWVIGARTVYSDPVAQRDVIDETYAMTGSGSPASTTLKKYHSEQNPFHASREKQVTVHVRAVVPITDDTWAIEWNEETEFKNGEKSVVAWQGSFTVQLRPPRQAAALMVNPLGVYVTNFSWTQRLAG